jgi:hypothetical protein
VHFVALLLLGLIRAQASVCARVQVIACEAEPGPLVPSVRSRSSVKISLSLLNGVVLTFLHGARHADRPQRLLDYLLRESARERAHAATSLGARRLAGGTGGGGALGSWGGQLGGWVGGGGAGAGSRDRPVPRNSFLPPVQ